MNAADRVLAPERAAERGPREALRCGGAGLGYAALLAEVNRAGNLLRAAGVRPEQRVLLLLEDSPELVCAYLGAIKIGAVAVALNVRLGPAEIAWILGDSRPALVIAGEKQRALFAAAARGMDRVPPLIVAGPGAPQAEDQAPRWAALAAAQPASLAAADMSRDDMAFWIYTSGTTGTPKAAVHLHHDVEGAVDYAGGVLGIGPEDRLFATSKLYFAYALGNCLFASFMLGATTILLPAAPESAAVAEVLERERPTVLFSVPTLYRNLLRDGVVTPGRFASVRRAVSAGERLPAVLFERFREASGGLALLDGMGTSETIYMILGNAPGAERPGSAGTVVPGVQAELRDESGRAIDTPGRPGILWAKMSSIADRYWNQQERSRAVFAEGWFRTGDVFAVDAEGYWHHEGRGDDMLKISGQWVSPAEIEEEVLAVEGVADAAVVGREDGDGLTRLALFVVPADGAGAAGSGEGIAEAIRSRLTGLLAVYKCPRRVHLVSEIPRTATGKVQRYKLREAAR